MDDRLVAWARAVKARRRGRGPPPLWLFTDPARTTDLEATIAALPSGLCGVVFRHDGVAGRDALLRRVARRCRARRIPIVVAGSARGASPRFGRHLRGGRGPGGAAALLTSSAHGKAELVRARRRGAALAFLSPAFATASHLGAAAFGAVRWCALARGAGLLVYALGGVTGSTIRRLRSRADGAGAIGALLP